jgi:uncharacterized membrane protein YdjX (TVP38/TMEM64 family)
MKLLILSSTRPAIKVNAMSIRTLFDICFSVLIFLVLWFYRAPLLATLRWFSDLEAVTASIKGYGLWGPVILCVLFILQTFLAFIPGQALMVASGYVYGFSGGIMLTWVSLVLGGQVAFWLARHYGRPFAEQWISANVLDRWDKSSAGQGIVFYTVTLVMPFFPNDAMCYVAGLGNMSGRRFLLANILGRGIASLLTVIVGAFADQIPGLLWMAILVFIVLGLIGWIMAKRFARP